jgi:hypothetical protein
MGHENPAFCIAHKTSGFSGTSIATESFVQIVVSGRAFTFITTTKIANSTIIIAIIFFIFFSPPFLFSIAYHPGGNNLIRDSLKYGKLKYF